MQNAAFNIFAQIICTYFICVQLNNLQLYAVIARWFIDTYMQIWCILDLLFPLCLLVILGPYHFSCTLIKLIEREKKMHKLTYDHWKRCSLNKDIKQYSAERFEQRCHGLSIPSTWLFLPACISIIIIITWSDSFTFCLKQNNKNIVRASLLMST